MWFHTISTNIKSIEQSHLVIQQWNSMQSNIKLYACIHVCMRVRVRKCEYSWDALRIESLLYMSWNNTVDRNRIIMQSILSITVLIIIESQIIPSNKHQEGKVDNKNSYDCSESLASVTLMLAEYLLFPSIRFLRPDHVLLTEVHTVFPTLETITYDTQQLYKELSCIRVIWWIL